ncbi:ribonuclease H-like domain-containing protein [Tanacetum coccineum]
MSVHNSVHNSKHGDDYIEDPDPVTLISKLDISNPLHLHPNDSTALTVVSIKLKGTKNYQVWSCVMLLALKEKNKTGFIDESCKRSNTNEVLGRQGDKINAVVLGWILNSISDELFLVLPDVRSAYATISIEESHIVASGSIVGSSQRNQASAFVSNSDSSHSSVSGGDVNTTGFLDNSGNDADSSEDIFATQNEKSDRGVFLALLVYVDDIIITGNNISEIEKFKVYLKSKFMITDLCNIKYFLGIKVINTDKGICLNQRKYVLYLLHKYGMLACKPVKKTPLMAKLVISNKASESDPILENITDNQKLMGKLIYLTNTRLDISYALHCLSQFMHSPLTSHLKTAFRILRYLKSFLESWLLVIVFFVNNSLVSWKSKKQNTLSLSLQLKQSIDLLLQLQVKLSGF